MLSNKFSHSTRKQKPLKLLNKFLNLEVVNYNLINANFINSVFSEKISELSVSNGKIFNINKINSSFPTIDLKGQHVIPGFTDSHFHLNT